MVENKYGAGRQKEPVDYRDITLTVAIHFYNHSEMIQLHHAKIINFVKVLYRA